MQLSAAEYATLVTNVRYVKNRGLSIKTTSNNKFVVVNTANGNFISREYDTIDECFAFVDGLVWDA